MVRKLMVLVVVFCLFFSQSSFAQLVAQLDVSQYRGNQGQSLSSQEKFRPVHLRYLAFHPAQNKFHLLLDRGDNPDLGRALLDESTRKLLDYFFVGVSLTNDSFWVNLRPDSKENIIDERLAKTDVGKVLLEADVQLKKDAARFASPETQEGKAYWDKLYQKAEEIFGSTNVDIPTITRPWIVPGEILIREAGESAYIYKATLNVLLEQDLLKNSNLFNFKDKRLKALNEYSAQLMRELILPKLVREINSSERYSSLRQVYYSLIFAQWFKQKFNGNYGTYAKLVDKGVVNGITSKEPWSSDTYYRAYLQSVKEGEYKVSDAGSASQAPRHYFGGGINFNFSFLPVQPVQVEKVQPVSVMRVNMPGIIPVERIAAFSVPTATFGSIDAQNINVLKTVIVKTGEISKVLTTAVNALPAYISTRPDFPASIRMANLEAAEIEVIMPSVASSSADISVTPLLEFPEVNITATAVATVGRNLAVEMIKTDLQLKLNIVATKNDEAMLKVADYILKIQTEGVPFEEAAFPEIPGVSKIDAIRVAKSIINNEVIPLAPVSLSAAEVNSIQNDVSVLPEAKEVQVFSTGSAKIPVVDISSRPLSKVSGTRGLVTSYNVDTRRLVVRADKPVILIRTNNQGITYALPQKAENIIVVARIRLTDGRVLEVVSPVADVGTISSLLTSIPYKGQLEFVRVIAPPVVIADMNASVIASNIGVPKIDVLETNMITPERITVVTEGAGAIIREVTDAFTEVKPLKVAEVQAVPVEKAPLLDVVAIQQSIATLAAEPAKAADFIKTEILKPLISTNKVVFERLIIALDQVITGEIPIKEGKSIAVEMATPVQKTEFVRSQNLPADQAIILASALKVELPAAPARVAGVVNAPPLNIEQASLSIRDLGGVDLSSMKILTAQGMGAGLAKASLGLSQINIGDEARQIENMIQKGILPASQRVKSYVEAVCQNPAAKKEINKAFTYLSEIFKLEEERALPTAPELAESLVLLESSGQ